MTLDSQAASFLDRAKAGATRSLSTVDFEEMRAAADALIPLGYDFEAVGRVKDVTVPTVDGSVPARVYSPVNGAAAMPVVLWLHGGSFTRCGLHTHDTLWRRFANLSSCVVVGLDFRLAPECPYPVALEQVHSAACWVLAQANELGGDGRLVVAGESSGGNLTAALTLLVRDQGGPSIDCVLLIEPLLDRDPGLPSRRELGRDYLLTDEQIHWAFEQYAPDAEPGDPLVHPLRAPDLAGLPPAVVVTVEYDPLRDEGERYVERLRQAGVPTRHVRIPGLIHHALLVPKAIAAGTTVLDEAARLLRDQLAETVRDSRSSP